MASVDYLSAVGAGSGLNISELTDSLVEAERAPKQESIDRKKASAELRISAYGVVKNATETLKSAFSELDDLSDISKNATSSSNPDAVTASANSSALASSFDINVLQLASRDTWIFDGFAAESTSLNNGNPFTVELSFGAVTSIVNVNDPTPSGIVSALNDSGLEVSASLINTGSASNPFVISVSGDLGLDNSFVVAANPSAVLTGSNRVSTARDAVFELNGLAINRGNNSVSDVAEGVTFNLTAVGSSTVEVTPDTRDLKERLLGFVEAYNGVKTVFDTLRSRDEGEDELTGSLSSDATFRSIESAIRGKLSSQISSGTGAVNYLAEIGISFNRQGFLEVDEDQLDEVLLNSRDDIISAFSNNTNDQSIYGTDAKGLAGDMVALLDSYNRSNGVITTTINNSNSKLLSYEKDLLELESRMERIRNRYLNQFAAMQRIVDEMNNTSDYLTSSWQASNKD